MDNTPYLILADKTLAHIVQIEYCAIRTAGLPPQHEYIDAHVMSIVFAALAVARLVEDRTGWSIRKFVRTARRYRTVQIHAGHTYLPRKTSYQ